MIEDIEDTIEQKTLKFITYIYIHDISCQCYSGPKPHTPHPFKQRLGGIQALWFCRLGGRDGELPRLHLIQIRPNGTKNSQRKHGNAMRIHHVPRFPSPKLMFHHHRLMNR